MENLRGAHQTCGRICVKACRGEFNSRHTAPELGARTHTKKDLYNVLYSKLPPLETRDAPIQLFLSLTDQA